MTVLMLGAVLMMGGGVQAAAEGTTESVQQAIARDVSTSLARLTEYGVFDYLSFEIQGNTVTLKGYASRPTLKDAAARVAAKVKHVELVDNQIEVLPLSRMDDQVRAEVYHRIYYNSPLSRYSAGGPVVPSLTRRAGGITADPPIGYHAIHIIVKNGHVVLEGAVNSEMDRDIAEIKASGAFGVFSVTNGLQLPMRGDQ